MAQFRRPFRAPPLKKRPTNVLQFDKHRQGANQRKTWWANNWAYAALFVAPIIGIGVAWLWQALPTTRPFTDRVAEQYDLAFSHCSGPIRVTCVVDGDTIWLQGQKIRIADINTPEVSNPQCQTELALGERATSRLVSLLNAGGFSLETTDRDEDRFGRKLRIITRDGVSLGDTLVAEGLAESWTGSRRNWC